MRELPAPNTAAARAVRRRYSKELRQEDPAFIFDLARQLIDNHNRRWLAYEFIRYHRGAFQQLGGAALKEFGEGINSWDTVDTFARTLSGPAWLRGQIDDQVVQDWAGSDDFWWRRAALVSTVALNMRSQGGYGDVDRTLAICRSLVADREDMVIKALSWALRELIVHEPRAVENFLSAYDAELAPRIKREVRNKLTTGLKNPT